VCILVLRKVIVIIIYCKEYCKEYKTKHCKTEKEKMKANEIRSLVENIHQSPYKNIMIDGAWGVGKSYEIQKALKKTLNPVYYPFLALIIVENFFIHFYLN
jgi:hypothetical protein